MKTRILVVDDEPSHRTRQQGRDPQYIRVQACSPFSDRLQPLPRRPRDRGLIDAIVARKDLKSSLETYMGYLTPANTTARKK